MSNNIDKLFSKKTILTNIKIFICIVFFHFLLTTIVRYGIGLDSPVINLRKDIYILFIYILILGYNYKKHWFDIRKFFANKFHVVISIMITVFSLIAIWVSYYNQVQQWLYQIAIGLKYDVFILLPIIFVPMIKITKSDIINILKSLAKTTKIIVIISFILRIVRFGIENELLTPRLLTILGFDQVGDFQSGVNPPMYYRTWADGLRRASSIFSGPNDFGFFIVSFLGVFFSLSFWKSKFQDIQFGIWYFIGLMVLLTLSMSRSGYGASLVIILACLGVSYKLYKAKFRNIFIKAIIDILGLTILGITTILATDNTHIVSKWYEKIIQRTESTMRHYKLTSRGIEKVQENPIGYGLGTVWPAVHYMEFEWLLPENWWIQIAIEAWWIWGLLYIAIISSIILYLTHQSNTIKIRSKDHHPDSIELLHFMIALGLIGLSLQWLVLHSFEDASVSLPFFTLIWVFIAYNQSSLNTNWTNSPWK